MSILARFFILVLLVFFNSSSFAKENQISLEKRGDKLIVYYDIPNATGITVDPHYKNLLIKNNTLTKSKNGKFKITLRIKSEISHIFYDPMRVYSNGEFLLYKSFLFPQKIIYKKGHFLDKDENKNHYPNFAIRKNREFLTGDRFVFWGEKSNIKVLGLEKNQELKNNVFQVYKKVFDYYTKTFGAIVKKTPIQVFDFKENGGEFGYMGDALDYFLSFNVLNASSLSKDEYYQIYQLISHEIFHIWNAYEHHHSDRPWLHEGSADYFSMESLFELSYIDNNTLEKLKKVALNACYNYYKERNEDIMNNNYSGISMYDCGDSFHIILEKLESKKIVLDIWKSLFKDGNYNSDDFFKKIKENPAISQSTIDTIYDFIYKKGGVVRVIERLEME